MRTVLMATRGSRASTWWFTRIIIRRLDDVKKAQLTCIKTYEDLRKQRDYHGINDAKNSRVVFIIEAEISCKQVNPCMALGHDEARCGLIASKSVEIRAHNRRVGWRTRGSTGLYPLWPHRRAQIEQNASWIFHQLLTV